MTFQFFPSVFGFEHVGFCLGANVDALAPESMTALHLAAREGDVQSMNVLLKASPKMIHAVSSNKVVFLFL